MPLVPELLLVVPLAFAAGIDLYLTLLFLGASPTLGLWNQPLPGALGDLDSPGVLIMVGAMYVAEFGAERYAAPSLTWNAFHAIIRPVSGMLLALLVLDGQPLGVLAVGSALGGAIASAAHSVRSGGSVIRWLGAVKTAPVLLVSLLEDAVVLGLVALWLDRPSWALWAVAVLTLVSAPWAPSSLRAFVFAVRLAVARVFHTLTNRRWLGEDELPPWVRDAIEGDGMPAGAIRGTPVGAHRLPGSPMFAVGWALVRGGDRVVVVRRGPRARAIPLDDMDAKALFERGFFRRLDLRTDGERTASLFFGLDGPSVASLKAEFL